jgi:hypothetical protein
MILRGDNIEEKDWVEVGRGRKTRVEGGEMGGEIGRNLKRYWRKEGEGRVDEKS